MGLFKRNSRPDGVATATAPAPVSHDRNLYRDRNTVERAINKIKDWRGLATRYDKTPTCGHRGVPHAPRSPE
jgi:transposase